MNELARPLEIATLGGGCFWCLEAVFDEIDGVVSVESGYSGGHVKNPAYREVCEGDTGHAEVVRIAFDPSVVSFARLLDVFFAIHDPTTLDRQGNDVGPQYRSVIFFHSPEQQAAADAAIRALSTAFRDPIVTQVLPAPAYYPAEDIHQEYFRFHGHEPYCKLVVAPKLAKFRALFEQLRKRPAA